MDFGAPQGIETVLDPVPHEKVDVEAPVSSGPGPGPGAAAAALSAPAPDPPSSNPRRITQSAAESVSDSASNNEGEPHSAAIEASTPRHSEIDPLWLKAHRPYVNGAQADRSTGIPTVADRTAANTAVDRICDSTSSTAGSVQIGAALRYRLTTGEPASAAPESGVCHQAAPNPSALMVPPPRISRGAHDCTRNECGPRVTNSPTGTGAPR